MISTKDLDDLIKDFVNKHRQIIKDDLANYEDIQSSATAIGKNKKKHEHQYRIKPSILEDFSKKINEKTDDFKQAESFEKIYSIVDSCRIYGIGPLAVYDTAVRIGRIYNIEPEKVYLQRGAKWGAQALGINKNRAEKRDFVKINKNFCKLKAHEIECFLCIYNKELRKNQ